MGILDDAIREHLELKRKHGVPEQELQRQEEEALGPVRREVAAAETQDGAPDAEAAPPLEPAEAVEPVPDEAAEESVVAAEDPVVDAAAAPVEPAPPEEPQPEALEASTYADPPDEQALEPKADHPPPEPVFDPSPEDAPPAGLPETPARGFEAVEDEEAAEADPEADVLEDTPDFLQETPEHDRLWFEQKPPRDFDFD